jgi:phenylacetate-CoA ligase
VNRFSRLANTGYIGVLALVERGIPFMPTTTVGRLQQIRLRSIVRHAYRTVPFYRQELSRLHLAEKDLRTAADLAKLPLIDGALVQQNRGMFLSEKYRNGGTQSFSTSGSQTQVPRVIEWDNGSVLRKLAVAERDRTVLNRILAPGSGRKRLYLLPDSSLSLTIRAYWEDRTLLAADLGPDQKLSPWVPYEVVAEHINQHRPALVFSYGSYADLFFRYLSDRHIPFNPPRVWAVAGDMLSPQGKTLMERDFGCVVHSVYQATETGRIGFQCERCSGFHLNIDLCAVRIADDKGNTLPAGESGQVIISNLHNRATVLLNYRLGDWATMAKTPCGCGRSLPLLDKLEGRTSEVLTLADGRRITGFALRMDCKDALDGVLQDQLIQSSPDLIRWRIVPLGGTDRQQLRKRLIIKSTDVLGEQTRVEVEIVEHIPFSRHGKIVGTVAETAGTGGSQ